MATHGSLGTMAGAFGSGVFPLDNATPQCHSAEAAELVKQFLPTADPPSNQSSNNSSADAMDSIFKRNLKFIAPKPVSSRDGSFPEEVDSQIGSSENVKRKLAALRIQSAWRKYCLLYRRSFCEYGDEAVRLVKRYMSGKAFEPAILSRAHLILHFDLNKTILISDKAQGADTHDMVNVLLSECVWGRMVEGPSFVPVGRLATDRPADDPQLMSYRNFLDSFKYPYVEGTGMEVQQENTRRKSECHHLKRTFTDPGQPGAMFSGVLDALTERLIQPEGERTEFFENDQRRILPSFFELILHLDRIGRSFTIVFRTFGSDITDVVHEINLFANGEHPSYPGVQLAGQGATDLRISIPENTGAFYRWGAKEDETILALGVTEKVLSGKRVTRELLEEEALLAGAPVMTGFSDIYSAVTSFALNPKQAARQAPPGSGAEWISRNRHRQNTAFALRDYYPYWKQRNERSQAGKLLVVDTNASDVIQVFFDDNIGHATAHIVDARHTQTGRSVSFRDAAKAHLLRVEPVNAILDPLYFVRAVNEAELAVLRRAEARHQEEHCPTPVGESGGSPSYFAGSAFSGLQTKSKSGIARVSLKAKQRWEWTLRKVLIMVRASRALNE